MEHKLEDEEVALERKDSDKTDDKKLEQLTQDAESTEAMLKGQSDIGELQAVAQRQEKTEEKLEQIEQHLVVHSQMTFTHHGHGGHSHRAWGSVGGQKPTGGGGFGWFIIIVALGIFGYFAKQHVDDEQRRAGYGEVADAPAAGSATGPSVIGGGLQTVPGI